MSGTAHISLSRPKLRRLNRRHRPDASARWQVDGLPVVIERTAGGWRVFAFPVLRGETETVTDWLAELGVIHERFRSLRDAAQVVAALAAAHPPPPHLLPAIRLRRRSSGSWRTECGRWAVIHDGPGAWTVTNRSRSLQLREFSSFREAQAHLTWIVAEADA